jgi:hypothetical protein
VKNLVALFLIVECFSIVACGQAPSDVDSQTPDQVQDAPELSVLSEPEPEEPLDAGCDVAFAPAPELADLVALAAQRWSRATGCAIEISDGGIPFVGADGLTTDDGAEARGGTLIRGGECVSITIVLEGAWAHRTIAHEMGHCLGAGGHSTTGIMATQSNETVIDAASLELVCANMACAGFAPER